MLNYRIATGITIIILVLFSLYVIPIKLFHFFVIFIFFFTELEYFFLYKYNKIKSILFSFFILIVPLYMEICSLFYNNDYYIFLFKKMFLWNMFFLIIGTFWWLFISFFLILNSDIKKLYNPLIQAFIMFNAVWSFIVMFKRDYILMLIIIVSSSDIGAYFVGSNFGKNKLSPKISPNKTIEGSIAGVLISILLIFIFIFFSNYKIYFFSKKIRFILFLILTLIVSMVSIIGDLFESILKRLAKLKDSGRLLPGHGGFYDRLDSFIASAPIFAIGCLLIEIFT